MLLFPANDEIDVAGLLLDWFEVYLSSSGDLNEDAHALRRALRNEGYAIWQVRDEDGNWFLAVSRHGPNARRDLERALRQAGLSGYFLPLRRDLMERRKV